jgi:hypothetical protein
MSDKNLAIVGLGPAGCIFLASLPPEFLTPRTVVYNTGCIGGDLARYYGCVVANLTCREIESALRSVVAWKDSNMELITSKYLPEQCPSLSDVCRLIRDLTCPLLSRVTIQNVRVRELRQNDDMSWTVLSDNGTTARHTKVVLCTGADPKQMNIPKPTIPLDVALCQSILTSFVSPAMRICVFGTAHSGTLILRNLKNLGCEHVTGIHRGEVPFRFARDGDTEGIKQESATIADEILAGAWGQLTPSLISADNIDAVLRKTIEADYVIFATGFASRYPPIFTSMGMSVRAGENYDRNTAKIIDGMWGFGIGFPSMYTTPSGTEAPDVGFGPFASHIRSCLAVILAE